MRPTISAICASPCSAVSLPRSTSLPTCPAVTLRASSRPGLHELLVDVLQHHRDPRGGDRLRDLPPHRPRAHHRCLEHEHAGSSSSRSDRLLLAWTRSLTELRSPPGASASSRPRRGLHPREGGIKRWERQVCTMTEARHTANASGPMLSRAHDGVGSGTRLAALLLALPVAGAGGARAARRLHRGRG